MEGFNIIQNPESLCWYVVGQKEFYDCPFETHAAALEWLRSQLIVSDCV